MKIQEVRFASTTGQILNYPLTPTNFFAPPFSTMAYIRCIYMSIWLQWEESLHYSDPTNTKIIMGKKSGTQVGIESSLHE